MPATPRLFRRLPALLCIAPIVAFLAVGGLPAEAHATPADTSDGAWVNLRVDPLAVWGPRVGAGGSVGVIVHDLGRAGSQILATGALARHSTVAALSAATTTDRREAERYAVIDARWADTGRQWFYGRGPASAPEARRSLDLTTWWTRLRAGQRLLPGVHVEPHVALVGGLGGSPTDAADLQALRIGADLVVDTRNRQFSATRGVRLRAGASRVRGLAGSNVRYDRFGVDLLGILPLGGRHRLVGRAAVDATNRRSEARIPFYLLPRLDGRRMPGLPRDRFYGRHRASLSALYRFPLAEPWSLFNVEGHVGAHAGSVYRQADQVVLDVSFDERLSGAGTAAPLRPTASVGLRLGPLFRDQTFVDVAAGRSAEGYSVVHFSVTSPLDRIHPPSHAGPPNL